MRILVRWCRVSNLVANVLNDDGGLRVLTWGVSVLAREYAVGFETVSKVRAERHKVHARLVKSAIDDL